MVRPLVCRGGSGCLLLVEDVVGSDVARDEPGKLGARAVESALHRAARQVEDLGDLLIGEILDVSKENDGSLVLVEPRERLVKYLFRF
jgi:hypothetical protein